MTHNVATNTPDQEAIDIHEVHHESVMLWGLTRALQTAVDAREGDGINAIADAIEKQSRRLADMLEQGL